MNSKTNNKNISIFGAFALSIGTAIGWGSFVIIGTSYVSKAGPLGSIIALLIGMLIMIVVGYNYHYMMNKYQDNGGIYSFAKHTIGSDHAFLIAWFLLLTYLAIFLANVSSFALFSRYIFGNIFQFGYLHTIGGFDVWIGEILLSTFFLCLFSGLCLLNKRITTSIQAGMVFIFLAIIIGGFIIAAIMHKGGIQSYKPDFSLTGENKFAQVMRIIGMTPWAFIGFESISHSTNNFSFPVKKSFKILLTSVILTTLFYILICELCISVFPDEYSNWYEYLTSSQALTGLDGIPVFYVIHRYIGMVGVVLFGIALFAIVSTSLVGNLYALCGLCQSMAKDGVLPHFLAKNNKNDNPKYIIIGVMIITFIMLFFGRVLIGWIVDVNNICGIIIYTYIAVITIFQAKVDKNKKALRIGAIGLAISIAFILSFIVGSVASITWIAKESIACFLIWSAIGLGYYIVILKKDKKKMLGHSMVATFGLYSFIIYSIAAWLAMLVKTYNDISMTVSGIIVCAIIAILTQVGFFTVFTIIRKREVDMQEKLVFGMATMVEGRDKSTGGHIKRTSKVVELLVNEMKKDSSLNINHRFYINVIKAAPMHDLGKIAIDDVILRKPGKYTQDEFAIMKSHSEEGSIIVKDILKDGEDEYFEQIAVNVARYHHEKWNGLGYPCGLKGEDIPLEARIMAIADVYDALVSKRVYKDEFSFEEANRIILESMGTHFDPNLEKYYLQAKEKIEEFYKSN